MKETKAFIRKTVELLQVFLISQFGCGGRDFQRNLLKKTTKGNHWGCVLNLSNVFFTQGSHWGSVLNLSNVYST